MEAEFILVSGKGGAGKSLHAAALAGALAKRGKKTLLVEMGHRDAESFSRLHEFFDAPPLGHKQKEVAKNLWVARLDPAQCLQEYLALKLPGGNFAAALLNNKVTRTFLDVVPGLTDIVALGKLWYELTNAKSVDCIVLDGPASGHALSLARSPKNFARLTKRGPLFRDASGMEEYFQSPKALTLLITLPELLSVTETIETKAEIQNDFKNVKIVINKILPEPEKNILAITPPPYQNAIRYYCERSEKENAAIKKLNEWEFPYFLQKNTLPEIRSLAQKKWEEING